MTSTAEFNIVKDIKEKKCYVSQNYDAEMKAFIDDNSKKTSYK